MEANRIIIGDALEVLKTIDNEIFDTCVTSPPYYALRDYGTPGQIGLEETVEEYIQKLVLIFREVRRTLRNDGTLWLNISDTYAGSRKGRNADGSHSKGISKSSQYVGQAGGNLKPHQLAGAKKKELYLIPQRLIIALQADGWYARQDIIWSKPNAMPESVKDRCTSSYEHIILLSKSPKYYFDAEAIKEPCTAQKGNSRTFRGGGAYTNHTTFDNSASTKRNIHGNTVNEAGKRNKRDVWVISTKGYFGAHFATFPEALIEPCILAGSRRGGVVFDPFIGSGTTAVVSLKNGRRYFGIEINPDYASLAQERIGEVEKY